VRTVESAVWFPLLAVERALMRIGIQSITEVNGHPVSGRGLLTSETGGEKNEPNYS